MMKYYIGKVIKEFDLFVLDGPTAGEYETNDILAIHDIEQLLGSEPGEGAFIIETPENKNELKALVDSYDPGTDRYKVGIEIAADGKPGKAKQMPPALLNLLDERRAGPVKKK